MSPEQFAEMLYQVPKKLASLDLSQTMADCAEIVEASVDNNFARRVDSEGATWAPHSPMTVALHGPHPLLILTGRMREAATGGSGQLKRIGQRTLELGISDPNYAGSHQYGDPDRRIPRRQFYYLHSSERPLLRRMFVRGLAEASREVWHG